MLTDPHGSPRILSYADVADLTARSLTRMRCCFCCEYWLRHFGVKELESISTPPDTKCTRFTSTKVQILTHSTHEERASKHAASARCRNYEHPLALLDRYTLQVEYIYMYMGIIYNVYIFII